MTFDRERHHRRSIRLPSFDYAGNAAYFLTLCTVDRLPLFGSVVDGEIHLSPVGKLVTCAWQDSPAIRPDLTLDAFVLMPNHLHGIVTFAPETPSHVGAHRCAPIPADAHYADAQPELHHPPSPRIPTRKPRSLGSFVAQFKATSTRAVNLLRNLEGTPVWQRGFHEHVVRDDRDLARLRAYIAANPSRWPSDPENHPPPAFNPARPHKPTPS